MERAAVLVRGNQVTSADLGFLEDARSALVSSIDWPEEGLPSAVARVEEMLIRRTLERCSGNRSEAAKTLNINRQLLYAKLKR
jgi:DNA-binding NtrC family response regulator